MRRRVKRIAAYGFVMLDATVSIFPFSCMLIGSFPLTSNGAVSGLISRPDNLGLANYRQVKG